MDCTTRQRRTRGFNRLGSLGVLVLVGSVLVPSGGLIAQDSSRSAIQRALASVVTLRTYDASGTELGLGSGFVLSDGRVATNSHIVAGAEWVEVIDSQGDFVANLSHAEALSTRLDLAVLPRVPGLGVGLALASTPPEVGDPVWVIGSPQGLSGSLSNGLVSAIREVESRRLIQVSAPISPGSSGGPILDSRGQVIGIVVSFLPTGQNLNFGASAADLLALIRSPAARIDFPERGENSSASTTPPTDEDMRFVLVVLGLISLAPEIEKGQILHGVLGDDDLEWEGQRLEGFRYRGQADERLILLLRSAEFDAELGVFSLDDIRGGRGEVWTQDDDDGGGGTDAGLDLTLPRDGDYLLVVTSHEPGEEGAFELSMKSRRTGTDWRLVTAGDNGFWFWDPQTVELPAYGHRRVWVQYRSVSTGTIDVGGRYDRKTGIMEFDCSMGRVRLGWNIYFLEGDIVHMPAQVDLTDWIPVPPQSVAEAFLSLACGDR